MPAADAAFSKLHPTQPSRMNRRFFFRGDVFFYFLKI